MDFIWAIMALIGVLGLFFVMVYALKKLNRGINYVNGSRMRVVDRVSVGRDSALLVVNVAGQLLLVSVTGQHIELLKELDMTPEEYAEKSTNAASGNGMSFSAALSEVLHRRSNGQEEDK